jgi:hypothetical protein
MDKVLVCKPMSLPRAKWVPAAETAIEVNPVNRAPVERLALLNPRLTPTREHLALMTTKYWGAAGVHLTVGFLDNPPKELRARIIEHMNAWAKSANVEFRESNTDPDVRIDRAANGYWSYVGTDIKLIPKDQPTMNLEGFTMQTLESEFHRVVRHETGHTLGFPHEHMRRELVETIDPVKAFAYFLRTQRWNRPMVRAQVLTPLEDSQLLATPNADPNSIMCYQIPGEITMDGQPIIGGLDISPSDYAFAALVYPKQTTTNSA